MFATDFSGVLTALRQAALPLYLSVMRAQHTDQASYDAGVAAIREIAERGGSAPPDLTALLGSEEYRAFLQRLDAESTLRVQTVLETREYEQRLARLKEQSLTAYVAELRPVGRDELVAALERGTIVNAVGDEGEPLPIRSDEAVSGAFLERPTATAWVAADLLVEVLAAFASAKTDLVANPQGLRLRQVVVRGGINLNWTDLPFPLGFEGCDFHGWISADHLQAPALSFDSCDFTPYEHAVPGSGAFNAAWSVIGDLRLWDCRGLNQLFLPDARIGWFAPTNPLAEGGRTGTEGWEPTPFRTVIDGAVFEKLVVPSPDEDTFGFVVSRTVRVEKLDGLGAGTPDQVAQRLLGWLVASERAAGDERLPEEVWDEMEAALRRSGHATAATRFGIRAAEHRTRAEGLAGWVKRWTLGPTVRYFYDNLRALWCLLVLLGLTWGTALTVALADPGQLVQSPLANDSTLPEGWFGSFLDRVVWSFLYAVDLVVSPISLGQADMVWPHNPWLSLLLAVYKGLSLVLLGLFVIGATGLAERRGR